MKLISMTYFVLKRKHMIISNSDKYILIAKYAKFLKQPLKLEMFVSDDKEKVLFEYNPEFSTWDNTDMENQNIEDLLNDDDVYFLNKNATKQFLK